MVWGVFETTTKNCTIFNLILLFYSFKQLITRTLSVNYIYIYDLCSHPIDY